MRESEHRERVFMTNINSEDQVTLFFDAISERSAVKILEMGTQDASFLVEVIGKADWAPKIELHCIDSADSAFDSAVLNAGEKTSTEFELVKHVGSGTEVNDAIMEASESSPFDAIFVSSALSREELLTACMVGHESLKANGVLALSREVFNNAAFSDAVASFRDMFAEAYEEPADGIFVKV